MRALEVILLRSHDGDVRTARRLPPPPETAVIWDPPATTSTADSTDPPRERYSSTPQAVAPAPWLLSWQVLARLRRSPWSRRRQSLAGPGMGVGTERPPRAPRGRAR